MGKYTKENERVKENRKNVYYALAGRKPKDRDIFEVKIYGNKIAKVKV